MTRNELDFESENVQTLFEELAEYAEAVEGEDITERVGDEVTSGDVAEIKVDVCSIEYIDPEVWQRVEEDLTNLVGRILTGRPPQRGRNDTRGEIRIFEFGSEYLIRNDMYDDIFTMIVPEDILRQECAEGWEAQVHSDLVESAHEVGIKSIELATVEDEIVVSCLMTFLQLLDVDTAELLEKNELEVRDEDLMAHMI